MAEPLPSAEPEVAIVFTPEPWVGTLHHFLADHGGARVREIVMDQRLALEDGYDVLVVSHRWPALTRSFIRQVHERHRKVLGVYDGDESTSRVFLANLGVDGVVASNAPMPEFLDAITAITPDRADGFLADAELGILESEAPVEHGLVIAIGGPAGAGRTELACALHQIAGVDTHVLVDADDLAPAIAQRLSLNIEPNLRTAIDAVSFGLGDLNNALQHTAHGMALVGLPNVSAWAQVRASETIDVINELTERYPIVIVDVGPNLEDLDTTPRGRNAVTRAILTRADRVALVVNATPRGIARATNWAADYRTLGATASLHAVLNLAPRDRFRRNECLDELQRTMTVESFHVLPVDTRVERAHWEGTAVPRSPYLRAVRSLAETLLAARPAADTIDLTDADTDEAPLIEATA